MGLKDSGIEAGGLRNATQPFGVPNSAILRYPLNDDQSASTATDEWLSNDGTINGASYSTTSAFGSHALDFDGTDDYVDIGEAATPTSISFLAHCESQSTGSIADLGLNTPTSGGAFFEEESSNLRLRWTDGSSLLDETGGSAVSSSGYEQVGFTISDSGSYQIIQDGSVQASGTPASSGLVWSGRTWALAIRAYDLASNAWDARMDEVELVDKVVSSSEITSHKDTGTIN